MIKAVTINGRFLRQGLSGVQRYAREIVQQLDARISAGEDGLDKVKWRLVAPPGTPCDLDLKAIEFSPFGFGGGHVWEQLCLPFAPGLLINLGNSGPVLRGNSIVVIHDAAVFRTPDNFGGRYAKFHQMMGRLLARIATIGTVSEFSRSELAQVLNLDPETIFVARNGAEHLVGWSADNRVLDRFSLTGKPYFLFVGSPTRNKNLATALSAFDAVPSPDARLVIVGSLSSSVFRAGSDLASERVIATGRLSDEEITALYRHATALVFPSLYEGFGIPPLEAMINDCPVIASAIPPVQETCGDAAVYFAPDKPADLTAILDRFLTDGEDRARLIAAGHSRARLLSWRAGSEGLAQTVKANLARS